MMPSMALMLSAATLLLATAVAGSANTTDGFLKLNPGVDNLGSSLNSTSAGASGSVTASVESVGGTGTLFKEQSLQQGTQLFSPDGTVFLVVQADGNVVLYNTARYGQYGATGAAAIWASGTYGASGAPFELIMQADCNLVAYSVPRSQQYGYESPQAAYWSSNTYGASAVPCTAVVSSTGGGSLSVQDADGTPLYLAPNGVTPPDPVVRMHRFDKFQTGFIVDHHLTPSNVNGNSFGTSRFFPADGQIYPQILFVPGLYVNGALHNAAYGATENNSVYAWDIDTGAVIWQRLGLVEAIPEGTVGCNAITPVYGIVSTPVIDQNNQRIFVVQWGLENGNAVFRLRSLSLTTGADLPNSPSAPISPSVTFSGSTDSFTALAQLQRPGLMFDSDIVYIAFGSNCDNGVYYPWVVGYNAESLTQEYVYVSKSPNNAFWQGGTAPSMLNGELFLAAANGDYNPATDDYGDSIIKLSTVGSQAVTPGLPNTLVVADSFTPANQAYLSNNDLDQGSTGAMLISNARYVVSMGKDGALYLLNSNNLGGYSPNPNNPNADGGNARQVIPNASQGQGTSEPGVFGSPAWWAGGGATGHGALFFHGNNDILRKYSLTAGGVFDTTTLQTNPLRTGFPGASPVLSGSSASASDVVLWDLDASGNLYAFDANTLTQLWEGSASSSGCATNNVVKFAVPIVAAGRVCHGCNNGMVCYSLTSMG